MADYVYVTAVGRLRNELRDALVEAMVQTLRNLGVEITDRLRDDLYKALIGHPL